jgi:hypothetical protein
VLIGPRVRIGTSARVILWPDHDDHLHAMFYADRTPAATPRPSGLADLGLRSGR